MKSTFLLAISLVVATTLRAQLPAVLQARAAQYDQARATLSAQAEAAVKPARDRYLAALAVSDRAARAAVKTEALAAITAETAAVNAGALPPDFPADLPRTLANDRRTLVAALANVDRLKPAKLRELATAYLKELATQADQAAKKQDAALTAAVQSEQQRATLHLSESGGGLKHDSVVDNSDFSQGQPMQWPQGWKGNVDFKKATDAQIVQDGSERFLRFRRLQSERQADLMPEKSIPIPAKTREVAFSVKMRVKELVPGKEYETYPSLKITTRDAADAKLTDGRVEARQDSGWRKYSGRCPVPENAKFLRVELGPFGAAGIIDFDDVEVEFR